MWLSSWPYFSPWLHPGGASCVDLLPKALLIFLIGILFLLLYSKLYPQVESLPPALLCSSPFSCLPQIISKMQIWSHASAQSLQGLPLDFRLKFKLISMTEWIVIPVHAFTFSTSPNSPSPNCSQNQPWVKLVSSYASRAFCTYHTSLQSFIHSTKMLRVPTICQTVFCAPGRQFRAKQSLCSHGI